MKIIYTFILFLFFSIYSYGQIAVEPPSKPTTGLKKFLGINTHFPMRGALGAEITVHGIGLGSPARLEYGVNYILTSWHNLQDAESPENVKEKGAFQIGSSVTFDRVSRVNSDEKSWRLNTGLVYKNIDVESRTIGWNIRVKNSFVLGEPEGNIFSNMYGTAEVGLSFLSIFNVYYGYNVYSKEDLGAFDVPQQTITFTLNLNTSLFRYGLQKL